MRAADGGSPEGHSSEEPEKSIDERFADFTRVLPWFDFAAKALEAHVARRARAREEAEEAGPRKPIADLTAALLGAIRGEPGSLPIPEVVEAVLHAAESGTATGSSAACCNPKPLQEVSGILGRWEVVWSGALTPLQRVGYPRGNIWVEVKQTESEPPVLTVHSGLPIVLFGLYLWTSGAGELVEGEPLEEGGPKPILVRFSRYWIDVAVEPRGDIGRVDGGFINNRISAFGAALLTPVLLEFGALKWFLERLGFQRVFEVQVPSPEGDGKTFSLEASLELYLTLLVLVAFPETLSTCPVPYLDAEAGICVFEIPMLGPAGDLPRWAHPGGNSAALIARRLEASESPSLMPPVAD